MSRSKDNSLFWRVGNKVTRDPGWKLFIIILEFSGIFSAIVALFISIKQTQLAQSALQDQQISGAWQILANSNGGNLGQGYALRELAGLMPSISYVDLSCSVGCDRPNDFHGLSINGENWPGGFILDNVSFRGSSIDDAHFTSVVLRFVDMWGVRFQDTDFVDVTFDGVRFDPFVQGLNINGGNFIGLSISDLYMVGSKIVNTKESISINISGVTFCDQEDCGDIDRKFFEGAWFHRDHPPLNLARLYPEVVVKRCGNGRRVPYSTPSFGGRLCERVRADQI